MELKAVPGQEGAGARPDPVVTPAAGLSAILHDFIMHCPERGSRSRPAQALVMLKYFLGSSGFHLCVLHRIGALFHRWRLAPLAMLVEKFIYHWYHCVIPCSLQAGKGLWFPHPLSIVIADDARLGQAVTLYQGVQLVNGGPASRGVVIGDGVFLGADAMVLGRSVGELTVVGARTTVLGDVPARHLATGHPAQWRPLEPHQLADRRHVLRERRVW